MIKIAAIIMLATCSFLSLCVVYQQGKEIDELKKVIVKQGGVITELQRTGW